MRNTYLAIVLALTLLLISGCGGSEEKSVDDSVKNIAVFDDKNMSGSEIFSHVFNPSEGLGPHFNANSCATCHSVPSLGGSSAEKTNMVFRIGFLSNGVFDNLVGEGGPTARAHSVTEQGFNCDIKNGISENANVVSLRSPPSLFGLGLVNAIPDALIEAQAVNKGYGIHGKISKIKTNSSGYRVGRFGWKAQKSELFDFTAEAFRNEIGLTNNLFANDNFKLNLPKIDECDGFHKIIEISDKTIQKANDFIASLPIKNAAYLDLTSSGYSNFKEAKCMLCHKPSYEVDGVEHFFFSDFLLHDMGDGLNDNFVQGDAKGKDWRTTPLHGLGFKTSFLHDERTDSLNQAIMEHRGEANVSMNIYFNFSQEQKDDLINFLKTL